MFGIVAVAVTCLCHVQASFGSPTVKAPTVQLDRGTFTGVNTGNVSRFLGIPYAKPPVGNLRFQRPVAHPSYHGHYNATAFGPSCIQQNTAIEVPYNVSPTALQVIDGFFGTNTTNPPINDGEDCLTVNVIKPAGIPAHTKLPVAVWIYGGGFEGGASNDPSEDGGAIVQRSLDLGHPLIYVSLNYRLSALGFLPGKEVKEAKVGNLGLRDQREALRWVQKYIAAFGGDPKKVTIWGLSAGAISVALQMVTNGGHNEGLFRAGFMQSGSPVPVGSITALQPVYDAFVANAGCSHSHDTLQCLREVPVAKIRAAINASPSIFSYDSLVLAWGPGADGDFLKDDPQQLVLQGSVSSVPFVTGDCDDEGTLFSLSNANITTDAEVESYLSEFYIRNLPNPSAIEKLLKLYPSDPTQGSPFDTGLQDAITPQFKRLAAIQGDIVFQAPRRFFLEQRSHKQPTWSYLYKRGKNNTVLGAYHGTDIQSVYHGADLGDYFIRFVTTLNPNGKTGIPWPKYTTSSPQLLTLLDGSTPLVITNDTYRAAGFKYLTQLSLEDPF
ncbi:carotenoid ester lipase precursor [Artomyces pyxidatus]|uniref:Carotenoid ester lipase n=1 Tax=Artomyces pyxidatus TaxID=48021 RepID=A0ACB8SIF5_9AGAM|nr:carotenoid ester lipase precursor [Artomyces pyxidatus]